jgi:glycosidase
MKRSLLFTCLLTMGCTAPTRQPRLVKTCDLDIRLPADKALLSPQLVISNGDKGPQRIPLTLNGEHYATRVRLPAARTHYWIEDGDSRFLDPHNALSTIKGGQLVSVINLEGCDTPDIRFVERNSGSAKLAFTLVLARSHPEAGLNAASVQAWIDEQSITINTEGDHLYVEADDLVQGKHWLRITASDVDGRKTAFSGSFWIEPTRFRWREATAYHIMIDRFSGDLDLGPRARATPPGRRMGGNLRGVIGKIKSGYFDRLGINVLWLSPLYRNADGFWIGVEGGPPRYESYHGYWPIRARQLEPKLGTAEQLKALVAQAHLRGIRVMADVVPNHVHKDHEYLRLYPSWFEQNGCVCGRPDCPWWRDIGHCWFTSYLPDVNWHAEGALELSIADMVWWLETFDLDGLRIDAVPMMPRRVTRHLVDAVKEKFESLDNAYYLLGETFTGPDGYDAIRYPLGANGLDGQFDFPLMWALRQSLAWDLAPLSSLFERWTMSQSQWAGSGATMATLIGNHDVSRFVTEAAGGWLNDDPWISPAKSNIGMEAYHRLQLALGFILTMPGLPVIYYGDEFGQIGGGDPDNRRPMRFDAELTLEEHETLSFTQRLGRFRRCHEALKSGRLEILVAGEHNALYRRVSDHGAWVLIRLNRGSSAPIGLQITVPMVDIISGKILTPSDSGARSSVANARPFEVWVPMSHECAFEGENGSN